MVYALYFAEDELYENEVEAFVTDLRLEYSIDVRTNLSSKEYAMNKQVFVFDSLMKADYVLIFCSPAFKVAEDHKVAKQPQPSGKIDISFNTSKRLISNLLSLYKDKICFLKC